MFTISRLFSILSACLPIVGLTFALALFVITIQPEKLNARPQPPPPPERRAVPIDGGLTLLAAAGGGYAIKKLTGRRKHPAEE